MHCYIKLKILGEFFNFRIRKLDRTKLYGYKTVVAKCGDDECSKAYINETGMIRLKNGCTKFFDSDENQNKILSTRQPDSDVSFNSLLNKEYCFEIDENGRTCFKDKPDSFLEKKVIAAYELTNPDERITALAKKFLGREIWCVYVRIKQETAYSEEKTIMVRFFSNDEGIFACINTNCWNGDYMYEDSQIRYENDDVLLGDEMEIDFEDLW